MTALSRGIFSIPEVLIFTPVKKDRKRAQRRARDELRAVREQIPLGTPGDIAPVVSFLLSEEGRWVSGQLLHTDGGFSARF